MSTKQIIFLGYKKAKLPEEIENRIKEFFNENYPEKEGEIEEYIREHNILEIKNVLTKVAYERKVEDWERKVVAAGIYNEFLVLQENVKKFLNFKNKRAQIRKILDVYAGINNLNLQYDELLKTIPSKSQAIIDSAPDYSKPGKLKRIIQVDSEENYLELREEILKIMTVKEQAILIYYNFLELWTKFEHRPDFNKFWTFGS